MKVNSIIAMASRKLNRRLTNEEIKVICMSYYIGKKQTRLEGIKCN